jgi:hypothetical protein
VRLQSKRPPSIKTNAFKDAVAIQQPMIEHRNIRVNGIDDMTVLPAQRCGNVRAHRKFSALFAVAQCRKRVQAITDSDIFI